MKIDFSLDYLADKWNNFLFFCLNEFSNFVMFSSNPLMLDYSLVYLNNRINSNGKLIE